MEVPVYLCVRACEGHTTLGVAIFFFKVRSPTGLELSTLVWLARENRDVQRWDCKYISLCWAFFPYRF